MNAAHLHLVLNHFPVMGLIFCLALLVAGMLRESPELVRTGLVFLVAVAVISIPVYLTGEPAEEIVEQLAGVSEAALEAHEDAALVSLIALEVIGALALFGLIAERRRQPPPRWLAPTLLALVIAVTGWVGWTSYLGGQIAHPEARADFQPPVELEEENEE